MPSSGKSEFIDQILSERPARVMGLPCARLRTHPMHIAKLAEKVGKPFYDGLGPRMTEEELEEAICH